MRASDLSKACCPYLSSATDNRTLPDSYEESDPGQASRRAHTALMPLLGASTTAGVLCEALRGFGRKREPATLPPRTLQGDVLTSSPH